MGPRLKLNHRFGQCIESPSQRDIELAVAELFDEGNSSLATADYEEHPNAWLECGFEAGESWCVITIDAYRSGQVRFTKYKDQDDDEAEFEYKKDSVPPHMIVNMMMLLAGGELSKLVHCFEDP